DVVGDVRAEVVAARAQLAGGQLLVADVEQQQRLHGVDVGAAAPIELVLDDVEKAAMQPLDHRQGLKIRGANGRNSSGTRDAFLCLRKIGHVTPDCSTVPGRDYYSVP